MDLENDPEIQNLVLQTQLDKNMARIHGICWDKCIDYADSSLSRKQESCLQNCAERFIDTSLVITQLFQKKFSSGSTAGVTDTSTSGW